MGPDGEIDDVDGFPAVIVDRPILLTTPRRSGKVLPRRLSVAHEIGHLLLHGDTEEYSPGIEKEADEFAAAFLAPASAMDSFLPQRLDWLGRTWGVSRHSLVRRIVGRDCTTESSARRAYQHLVMTEAPEADPTTAYPSEMPTLLKKAAEIAADLGAGVPVLAEHLKIAPRQVRELLGESDQRPRLRLLIGG